MGEVGADFFTLKSIPGAAWPAIPSPDASQLWACYQQLNASQWLQPAELEARQLRQLRELLTHCFHEIPYYKRVLTEAGFPKRPILTREDLRRIPLLTRQLYQDNFDTIQADTLPSGTTPLPGGYTSGTNGVPIKVLTTSRSALWWRALFLRDLEWSGIDPRGRLAAIRLIAIKNEDLAAALAGTSQPSWSPAFDALIESGPSYAMDIRQDSSRQLAWLDRVRPDYLLSLPTNLDLLAGLIEERGARLPQLRAIQAIGEPLTDETRARIESAFAVPVKNLYSTTEAGYIASQCPSGTGLHVHSENVIAEVLDERDRPCEPGQTGRLVFTTLHNFLAPFIRYDILDEVTLASEPCACGRGLPLWARVEGRRHLNLVLPDGRRKSSMGISLGVRKVGGFRQFQFIQRARDHAIVRIVPTSVWSETHRETVERTVREEFEAPIRVDVELCAALERTAGGKIRLVVIEPGAAETV